MKMNAKQVKACLRARHPAPEWVWAEEFNIGNRNDRRIDGLAFNCFPSRGHILIGYEIKVSRADFLAELKDPDKRKEAVAACDRFYFATPKGLIKIGEMPPDCGLIECWMGDLNLATPEPNPEPHSVMRIDRWPKRVPDRDLDGLVNGTKPRWFMASVIRQFDPRREALKWQTRQLELESYRDQCKAEAREAWAESFMV